MISRDRAEKNFQKAIKEYVELNEFLLFYKSLVLEQIKAFQDLEVVYSDLSQEYPRPKKLPLIQRIRLDDRYDEFLNHFLGLVDIFKKYHPEHEKSFDYVLKKPFQDRLEDEFPLIVEDSSAINRFLEDDSDYLDIIEQVLDFTRSLYFIKAADQIVNQADLSIWRKGYCPFCGTPAGYGRIDFEKQSRILFCPLCWQEWTFMRVKCAHCENNDPNYLEYIYLEELPQFRAYLCNKCHRYIRVTDERHSKNPSWSLLDYFVSIRLETVVQKKGYLPNGKN